MILSPTPDIELALFDNSHAAELFRLVDAHRPYLRSWLPWLDSQQGIADTIHFIQTVSDQYKNNEALTLGIWHQKVLSGVIGFHRFDWLNKSSMIGYWLAADKQGMGIMTESCRAIVDFGFHRIGLHRIEIKCATGNTRSRAIPERLGFLNEGTARNAEWLYDHYVDLVVYSMLAHDWKKSQH